MARNCHHQEVACEHGGRRGALAGALELGTGKQTATSGRIASAVDLLRFPPCQRQAVAEFHRLL